MESLSVKKTNGLISDKDWEEAQKWELDWQLNQQFNSFNEELKCYNGYAPLMGLDQYATNYYGIRGWDFGNEDILDIGGGGQSILLKSKARRRVVVDPLNYSDWIKLRYKEAGIVFLNIKGEDISFNEPFDQCLIYNCLQHTENPKLIIEKALQHSKIVRIFEWIDEPVSSGHIHTLTENELNEWLGGYGAVKYLNESPTVGLAYFGIFKGNHYE